jgi:predicted dienelactone hydrolase
LMRMAVPTLVLRSCPPLLPLHGMWQIVVFQEADLDHFRSFIMLGIVLLLFGCSPAPDNAPEATAIIVQATPIRDQASATVQIPAVTETPTRATKTEAVVTQTPTVLPLSQPGPYFAGARTITLVDESRGGREITVSIWYPAKKEQDANGNRIRINAAPDMSAAPYPLILTGPNSGDMLFSDHLATHGFVTAIVRFPDLDYGDNWGFGVIEHPQDMVFVLDQLASNPPEGLEGVIDTDHTGVTGYSWDGFFSLALSGVRIDPDYYLAHCEQPPPIEPAQGAEYYLNMTCSLSKQWDEFAAHVGDRITTSNDGLWQPVTDERIRATLPMAADGAWLYGERGLAAVDRPVLMIAPTEDELIPYQVETRFIFENLGSQQKSLISFIGRGHMMVVDVEQIARMKHFATAYFGYYLQGRQDYQELFSEEYISQFKDLAWGLYSGE